MRALTRTPRALRCASLRRSSACVWTAPRSWASVGCWLATASRWWSLSSRRQRGSVHHQRGRHASCGVSGQLVQRSRVAGPAFSVTSRGSGRVVVVVVALTRQRASGLGVHAHRGEFARALRDGNVAAKRPASGDEAVHPQVRACMRARRRRWCSFMSLQEGNSSLGPDRVHAGRPVAHGHSALPRHGAVSGPRQNKKRAQGRLWGEMAPWWLLLAMVVGWALGGNFSVGGDLFLRDGQPFRVTLPLAPRRGPNGLQIVSGEIHFWSDWCVRRALSLRSLAQALPPAGLANAPRASGWHGLQHHHCVCQLGAVSGGRARDLGRGWAGTTGLAVFCAHPPQCALQKDMYGFIEMAWQKASSRSVLLRLLLSGSWSAPSPSSVCCAFAASGPM